MRVYEGSFPVAYGQLYLLPNDSYGVDLDDAFRGQRNGICGTAVEESAFLITGLHTGDVQLAVDLLQSAPNNEQDWHEVVEAPLTVGNGGLWLVSWCNQIELDLRLLPGTYRIRYCAQNMDAEKWDAESVGQIENYYLAIWPSVKTQDEIIKQTSETAKYWHTLASNLDSEQVLLERTKVPIRPNSNQIPEFVYIPTEDAYSKVVISMQTHAVVGEWVELHATRQNSPWIKVRFTHEIGRSKYTVSPPREFEKEVAANLCWKVEPERDYSFNVPTMEDARSNCWGRRVCFHKTGKYQIQALSASPMPAASNVCEILITDS